GIVRRNNHPAIIDEELFWSVYDHLRDTRPDGEQTNRVKLVRYSQRVSSEREALLSFTSSQEHVSVSFGKSGDWYHYVARRNNGVTREALLAIEADFIENAIIKKLFEKLQYADIGELEKKRKAIMQDKAARV